MKRVLIKFLSNFIFSPKPFNEKNLNKILEFQRRKIRKFKSLKNKKIRVNSIKRYDFFENRITLRNFSGKKLNKRDFDLIVSNSFGLRKGGSKRDYSLKQRTFPSAGGLNLIECLIYIQNVSGIKPGIYLYNPYHSRLILLKHDISLEKLLPYCENIEFKKANFVVFLMSNLYPGLIKYGVRSYKYALLEAGHAAQNLLLILSRFNLGGVCVGAFNHKEITKSLNVLKGFNLEYGVVCGKLK